MLNYFGPKDIIDILLVALVMYQLYRLVRRSGSSPIFKGVVAFIILWILISKVLQMRLMGVILDQFVNIGLVVLVILFQDELRRFLMTLGTSKTVRFVLRFFRSGGDTDVDDVKVMPLVIACMNMAKTYTGALIVIEQEIKLDNFEDTGEIVNADISTRLIENIFFKNSPLHDGAMIIVGDKIKAAGCILPVSQSQELPKSMGLRHRAALGMTEETDAKVIVVSEERGKISYSHKGELHANITPEKLKELLTASAKADGEAREETTTEDNK